jgi:hypothetical protein
VQLGSLTRAAECQPCAQPSSLHCSAFASVSRSQPEPHFLQQPAMKHSYHHLPSIGPQNVSAQHIMAPPPSTRPAVTHYQPGYAQRNHPPHLIERGLPSTPSVWLDPMSHMLHPFGETITAHPLSPDRNFSDVVERSIQPLHSTIHGQNVSRRTTSINTAEWAKHKATIHKLWIEEDRTLPETMAIMSEKHQFRGSYVFVPPEIPFFIS